MAEKLDVTVLSFAGCDPHRLREYVFPFFESNVEEWRRFVSEFLEIDQHPPLLALAKFFILQKNQPFDMPTYMQAQAAFIRNSVKELSRCTWEDRQNLVGTWLKKYAQSHREFIMLQQTRCIEDYGDRLLPFLEGLLQGVLPEAYRDAAPPAPPS